jgi:tRNA pseudouridine13 synthase
MPMDLPYPYGAALASGVFKSTPADFEVEEVLGFEPDGEGEHLFLWVEKKGLSTPELIARIAHDHSLKPAVISHSGLKDKHALTRQWLSLHLPGNGTPFDRPAGDGYRVLRQLRHHRKLRPGTHKSNRFRLRLREVSGLGDVTREQIETVASAGFANYFGHQRFGSKQDNVQQALQQLHSRKMSRSRRSLLLSSLRSQLFNLILARRIELGCWAQPLDGDVFMLRGSHSIFSEKLDADLLARYRRLDISSCASLYGSGVKPMSGQPRAIEQAVFAECADITSCLDRHGSRLQMRPLRALADGFEYDFDAAAGLLNLQLSLPAGSYVTSLLDHFIVLADAS